MTTTTAAAPLTHESRMLIGGRLIEGEAGRFPCINPANEEVIAEVSDASTDDMRRAIDAARQAFDETGWSTDRALRRRCLEQFQAGLEEEREQLREELILEAGCPRLTTGMVQLDTPLREAISAPLELMDSYAWETDLGDAMSELTQQANRRLIWREPVGVVGAITPWNYPFEVAIHKLGQALAAGNTVILKPAPDTPLNAARMARIIAEKTDMPPGVVNIVNASDHMVAEELTLSPKVDMISFTGSTKVGRRIMEKGAATMKRLFLELGGKSATIVLEDADLAQAANFGLGPLMHAGQGCATPTRMLLPRSRYEEAVAMLAALYNAIEAGDPQDDGTICGPVISRRQRDSIRSYIEKGVAEGARLVAGGPEAPAGRDRGFWIRPTLFADVDNGMTIAQEEIFGPVLCLIPFDDEEDAIRIANDSPYGLAGNVISGALDRSLAVARRMRTGFIGVNGGAPYFPDVPFGGYKASGVGRQNGTIGFDQYTEVKSLAFPSDRM